MSAMVLPLLYLKWHYSRALRDILGIWSNLLWFVGNLFSIGTLFRTLIAPLKLIEERQGNLLSDPKTFAENLLVNMMMRMVGMGARLILIMMTCVSWVFLLLVGAAFFILWFIIPFLLVGLFGLGLTILI